MVMYGLDSDDQAFINAVEELGETLRHCGDDAERVDHIRSVAAELHEDFPSLGDTVADVAMGLCQEMGMDDEFKHITF